MENSFTKLVLVTGGLDYIGSHTVVELLNENLTFENNDDKYEIVVIDSLSNSKEKVLSGIKKITNKNLKVYDVDLTDFEALEKIFKDNSFYAVIHSAYTKSIFQSEKEPISYFKKHINEAIILIELCIKYQVRNFVYPSSVSVYGKLGYSATEEELNINPYYNYGKTKWMVEKILKAASRANKNFKCVILRICNPVSAHKSGLIGEIPNIPENLFPVIEKHISGKLDKIILHGNDYNTHDGTPIRDYVHVVDVAKAHVISLQSFHEKNSYLFKDNCVIFNIGTNIFYTVLEIINAYMKYNEVKINYEIKNRRLIDVENVSPNCDKFKNVFGWKPEFSLVDICRNSYNFIKNNMDDI